MYDTVVIGGGPAGLAAAISANKEGAKVLLIEREPKLGGILKQCIHDGFGLITFKEKLSGPEYSERFIDKLFETDVEVKLLTFVTKIEKTENGFTIYFVNRDGASHVSTKTIVLATGCRERTARQIFIQGTRPSGVFTAGTAQNYVNLMGEMPTKRCVILGSGDIGLIMARRLVDEKMQPIKGTEEIIECDALILSVGLIPENELAESLDVDINRRTKGPVCDQNYMTSVEGVYSAGNCLHVNDLVDYVTENALEAGRNSAHYEKRARKYVPLSIDNNFLYIVPTVLDVNGDTSDVTVYFRASRDMKNARLRLSVDGKEVMNKKYQAVRPPEMERLKINFKDFGVNENSKVEFTLFEEE